LNFGPQTFQLAVDIRTLCENLIKIVAAKSSYTPLYLKRSI